ncbi:MAG: oligosaccharide flippase family protein [Acetobacteraceae bacterium]
MASLARPGSILQRTAHGAAWVIGWRLARRLIGVISTLILVRLLSPADFGLVALGYGFVSGLDVLCTVGVEQAIIRDDRPDRELYDCAFTINLLRAIAMGAALAACAGAIAGFLGDRRLDKIVLVFAAMTALTGLTNIGVVDFRRYIAFDKEFVLQIVPQLLAFAVTILVAVIWRTYWALVCGIFLATVAGVAFGYWMHPFRPHLTLRGWRRLFHFSMWMWVLGLIATFRGQAPILILGRLAGPASVGILTLGSELANLAITELVLPLSRAAFPGFASARRDKDDGAETLLRILAAMALVAVPVGIGTSLVAFPLVKLAFGSAWMPAVPLIEVLGVAGTLTLFGTISSGLFTAHAWMRPMAKINATTTIACLVLLGILVPRFGVLGAAVAIAITDAINQATYLAAALQQLNLQLTELLSRVWRCIFGTAAMTLVLVELGLGWTDFPETGSALLFHLFGTVALGAGIYVTVVGGAWLVSGRPDGGEADLVTLAGRIAGRLLSRQRLA